MAKTSRKAIYTLTELGEIALKKFPGHYKDVKNASATISYFANRLGVQDINGKKKFKQISATDADRIFEKMRQSYEEHPKANPTPIEQEIRKAEREDVVVIEDKRTIEEQIKDTIENTRPMTIKEQVEESLKNADVRLIPDTEIARENFEATRKRFYTDARYWLNMAQSPAERIEIWHALSALYGTITPKVKTDPVHEMRQITEATAQPIKPETDEQADKWTI